MNFFYRLRLKRNCGRIILLRSFYFDAGRVRGAIVLNLNNQNHPKSVLAEQFIKSDSLLPLCADLQVTAVGQQTEKIYKKKETNRKTMPVLLLSVMVWSI